MGTLVITMCGLAMANVKAEAEKQQLTNIANYVAAKSTQILACASQENITKSIQIDVPQLIGNQRYWIQLQNNTAGAWIEAGFGTDPTTSEKKALIPSEAAASGYYISGSGPAFLEYHSNNTGLYLTLDGAE